MTTAIPSAMTPTEFANHIQRSRHYVYQLKSANRVVVLDDGRLDVAASLKRMADTARQPQHAVVVSTGYAKSREAREHYAAETARIEFDERCGKLVSAADVVNVVATAGTLMRSRLEMLPSELAPRIAALSDENECRAVMSEFVESLLTDLSAALSNAAGRAK
jgi:hypothetical protein